MASKLSSVRYLLISLCVIRLISKRPSSSYKTIEMGVWVQRRVTQEGDLGGLTYGEIQTVKGCNEVATNIWAKTTWNRALVGYQNLFINLSHPHPTSIVTPNMPWSFLLYCHSNIFTTALEPPPTLDKGNLDKSLNTTVKDRSHLQYLHTIQLVLATLGQFSQVIYSI